MKSKNLKALGLSRREWEVAELLVKGLTTQEVAIALFLSYETIHSRKKNIYRKLNVSNSCEFGYVIGTYVQKSKDQQAELRLIS